MSRHDQRIAELLLGRKHIDAELERLGYRVAPEVIPVSQDWLGSAHQILNILDTAPDLSHVQHLAIFPAADTPDQQAERRRVLERDAWGRKAS